MPWIGLGPAPVERTSSVFVSRPPRRPLPGPNCHLALLIPRSSSGPAHDAETAPGRPCPGRPLGLAPPWPSSRARPRSRTWLFYRVPANKTPALKRCVSASRPPARVNWPPARGWTVPKPRPGGRGDLAAALPDIPLLEGLPRRHHTTLRPRGKARYEASRKKKNTKSSLAFVNTAPLPRPAADPPGQARLVLPSSRCPRLSPPARSA